MRFLKYTPLIIFFLVSVFLFNKIKFQKELEPLKSALIEKPFPNLNILSLEKNYNINNYIKNRPVIINIFASWCAPCRTEHQVFKNYSKDYNIIGIAYKDSKDNIKDFLLELGNPYQNVFFDFSGKESINLGLYGVPETFFLDKNSKVLHKHVGPIKDIEFRKIVSMIYN